jgi:hypothetical protein
LPDGKLNKAVGVARHALALDEARASFAPVLWNEEDFKPGGDPRIKQVWFAGVHSNVGGGYPHQGMSLVALDWMMSEAASLPALGAIPDGERLRFIPQVRDLISAAADVNGKLYDSRAGWVYHRWKPRDAEACVAARCTLARASDGARANRPRHRRLRARLIAVDPGVISWCRALVTVRASARDAHRSIGSQSLVESIRA